MLSCSSPISLLFSFNEPPPTEIYTLSLHDALPICLDRRLSEGNTLRAPYDYGTVGTGPLHRPDRSEEHTSELQSRLHLVCRLLLEKKKHKPLIVYPATRHHVDLHSRAGRRCRCGVL